MNEFTFEDFGYKSEKDFEEVKKQPRLLKILRDRERDYLKVEAQLLYREARNAQLDPHWVTFHQQALNDHIHKIAYLNSLLKNCE